MAGGGDTLDISCIQNVDAMTGQDVLLLETFNLVDGELKSISNSCHESVQIKSHILLPRDFDTIRRLKLWLLAFIRRRGR